MKARYLRPGFKSWILVDVFERCGEYYRIIPCEWYGVTRKSIYVPADLIEILSQERP